MADLSSTAGKTEIQAQLAGLLARVEAAEAENLRLSEEVRALRSMTGPHEAPVPHHCPAPHDAFIDDGPLTRRRMLVGGAVAAAAGTAAALVLGGAPSAADDGQTLVVGTVRTGATSATGVSASIPGVEVGRFVNTATSGDGLRAEGGGTGGGCAVRGVSTAGNGITGQSTSAFGVNGGSQSGIGIEGSSDTNTGVMGSSNSGTGVAGTTVTGQFGVQGWSSAASGAGVRGDSGLGDGVHGASTSGNGVFGSSETGTGVGGGSTSGIGVRGGSDSSNGVEGTSTTGNGVRGSSSSGDGVVGESTSGDGIGGYSGSGIGTRGTSNTGTALYAVSNANGLTIEAPNHLNLVPRGSGAPITDTHPHGRGELVEDSEGNLWLCTSDGTPGTWRKLAGPATAGAFHVLPVPIRVYDSRPGTAPSVGLKIPLSPSEGRLVDLTANKSKVPTGATAAMVNLLVVNAYPGNANFTIWANGASRPAANTMVWGGSAGRFSSPAVTALDLNARCVVSSSVRTDIVVDVVGYYR